MRPGLEIGMLSPICQSILIQFMPSIVSTANHVVALFQDREGTISRRDDQPSHEHPYGTDIPVETSSGL